MSLSIDAVAARPCCPSGSKLAVAGGRAQVCLGDDGIVHLSYAEGTVLGGCEARAVMSAVNGICAGQRRPLLAELHGLDRISRDALWVFSVRSMVSALALVGASPVDMVLARFFTALHTPPCPTGFFGERPEAVQWLRSAAADPAGSPPSRPWFHPRRAGTSRSEGDYR